mgnify:CR=1 FL=1
MALKAPRRLTGNLKSRTSWVGALETTLGAVAMYLIQEPAVQAIVISYGPQAVIAFGVAKIILRNVTKTSVEEK